MARFYLTQDVDSGEWTIVDNSGNVNWPEHDSTDESGNLAVGSTEEQIFSYLSELYNEAYSLYYDGLHYQMSSYTETTDGDKVTATFLWTMYFLGKGWDVAADEGVEQEANLFLQASTIIDEAGMIDLENISILANDGDDGETGYSVPVEEFFPS